MCNILVDMKKTNNAKRVDTIQAVINKERNEHFFY